MTNNKRKLGQSTLEISPIAFGGNVFGWTLNEQASFSILDAWVDGGYNFIDTADTYSTWVPGNKGGESETIIGNWLAKRGKRDDIVLATKLGGDMGGDKKGLKASYIKEAVDASLQRLKTDYIDLYQTHYDDKDTPVEETMEALNELIKEGKVRYIGASNFEPERIKQSNIFAKKNRLEPYVSLQPLYNLFDRAKFEQEYLKLVEEEQLAVLNYYALASGFLSGKYRKESDLDKSPRGAGVKKYLNERGAKILTALDDVANNQQATQAQIAIAWLLHKPYITAPIASATNEKQLSDLMAAATIRLTAAEVTLLDHASEW